MKYTMNTRKQKSNGISATTKKQIPVFRPSYGAEELELLKEVLASGWTGCGPKTAQFEQAFARYIGTRYAVGTNSCTASLHLALKVLNLEGAEVITTPMTFVSTNHAILYNGGIPVFADIEPDTLSINPKSVQRLITKKTKAIVVVHYGGHPCEMNEIMELARQHGLYVIEDCAHACGAEYQGTRVGSLGVLGCFSFHAVKNLSVGDGGMITTNDEVLYKRLMKLRWVGITRDTWNRSSHGQYSWFYDVEELGFKYQMNDVMAAIGLAQLAKLDSMNRRRRLIVAQYRKGLEDLAWIELPVERTGSKSAFHAYVVKTGERDRLNLYLKEAGIGSSVHYYPNHLYRMYQSYRHDTAVCDEVWQKILTLPLFPDLTDEEAAYIIETLRAFRPEGNR